VGDDAEHGARIVARHDGQPALVCQPEPLGGLRQGAVLEREAMKFAAGAAREIEVAQRLAKLDAEVERLRSKGAKGPAGSHRRPFEDPDQCHARAAERRLSRTPGSGPVHVGGEGPPVTPSPEPIALPV
jgi:hypothetical protein